MTTLRTRQTRLLANRLLDRTTDHPGSQKYPSRRTGMMTWMLTSSYPRKRTKPGIRPTTRMDSTLLTKRTRPSPRVLVEALSASSLLSLPYHPFRTHWNPSERPSRAPPPCPFFPFLPDANRPHIPLWLISLYVPGARLPSPCYPPVHQHNESADAYEKSRVRLTTTFSSSSTGNKISHPYPPHLNHPPQVRGP